MLLIVASQLKLNTGAIPTKAISHISASGVNAGWLRKRNAEGVGCGEGVFPSPPRNGSREGAVPRPQKMYCFVISKWHILVNTEVLSLNVDVIILGDILIDVPPNQNIGGYVPGIPGGVDGSDIGQPDCGKKIPEFGMTAHHINILLFRSTILRLVVRTCNSLS